MSILGFSEPAVEDEDTQYVEEEYAEAEEFAAPHLHEAPQPVDTSRIITIKPTRYEDARSIGESFRDGIPVIINLTQMTSADSRRMVDFASGLIFGLHGAIERIDTRIYLISPETIKIDGPEGQEANSGYAPLRF